MVNETNIGSDITGPNLAQHIPSANKLTLEEELIEKGFKSINEISSLKFGNPIPEHTLDFCLKELIYQVSEDRTIIKDFAILPNREATDNELANRGYYRIYVLPAD